MTALTGRLRPATTGAGHRVTTFELFFDLVYVFGFTQITHLMAETHSALGVLQALIVLLLLWTTWVAYSWLANQSPADQGVLRIGFAIAMVAVFAAALAIPESFGDLSGGLHGGLVLVAAYTVVRAVHSTLYALAAGDDADLRRQVIVTFVIGALPAIVLLLAGAIIGGYWQVWIWLAAVAWDAIAIYVTSSRGGWRLNAPRHWSERYGLVVILALGESVVAIGVGVAREPITVPIVIGSALAMVLAILMWWLYFIRTSPRAEHYLAKLEGEPRVAFARDGYTYLHFLLIAGVIIGALGVEHAMGHLGETHLGLFAAFALGGGVSLYLAGCSFFAHRARLGWPWWRLGVAVALLAGIPLLAEAPPLVALGAVVVSVAVVAVGESLAGLQKQVAQKQVAVG
jgi:low temperature requirement protein LtrA